ncbi:hypothetical protein AB3S75_001827 [Citrus x aurantiifolia]
MGYCCNYIIRRRLCSFSSFAFVVLILSSIQMRFMAEAGRTNLKTSDFSEIGEEDKAILRARIGSSPPKCERRCSWCGPCEAIQVPTNPQVQNGKTDSSTVDGVAYAREDNSNYKPMSWKCKCGKIIFDP